MQNTFRKLLAPPQFPGDDEKTRIAGLLNSILLAVLIIVAISLPILVFSTEQVNRTPLLTLAIPFIVINVAAFLLVRRGNVLQASSIFLLSLGVAIFGSYALSEPQSIGASLSLLILISFTTLLLGPRALIRTLAIIIVITLLVAIGHSRGWIIPVFKASVDPISNWISISTIFLLSGFGFVSSSQSLKRALDKSRLAQADLQTANLDMSELQKALESRVHERTVELEKRAGQLQTISSVARAIVAVKGLNSLLPEIVRLVSERFNFYHAGIFLIDDAHEYAVLQAANSEGGQRMLERGHRLKLGTGVVGFAAQMGKPHIALDVGADAVHFSNPDLPATRSEMALPLLAGERVIGVLDVQSTVTGAFSKEDIDLLSTLADQVAIAIENARLFDQSREALLKSQETFDRYVAQSWRSFAQQVEHNGFVFDGRQVIPLENRAKGEPVWKNTRPDGPSPDKEASAFEVPLRLRGQTVGILEVRSKKGSREWTRDEIALLNAAAERAALALENARLVEGAQRRAARERSIGEISSKIGTASDLDTILQITVEELGRKIGAAEVTLELAGKEK